MSTKNDNKVSSNNEHNKHADLSQSPPSPFDGVNNSKSNKPDLSKIKEDSSTKESFVSGCWHPGNINKSPKDPEYSWHHHTPAGRKVLSELSDSFYMD